MCIIINHCGVAYHFCSIATAIDIPCYCSISSIAGIVTDGYLRITCYYSCRTIATTEDTSTNCAVLNVHLWIIMRCSVRGRGIWSSIRSLISATIDGAANAIIYIHQNGTLRSTILIVTSKDICDTSAINGNGNCSIDKSSDSRNSWSFFR